MIFIKNIKIPLLIIFIGIALIIYAKINITKYTTYKQESPIKRIAEVIIYNKSIYKTYPSKGDYIGTINIPLLNRNIPIYEGTSSDELRQGVGHFIESVLPGEKNNSVISGHRDTVFKGIGKLKKNDEVIITTEAGIFTYQVDSIKIVKENDKSIIVPTISSILTITTCYPFNYVGLAPDRYIINLVLTKSLLSD